jgi:hypothetical protein
MWTCLLLPKRLIRVLVSWFLALSLKPLSSFGIYGTQNVSMCSKRLGAEKNPCYRVRRRESMALKGTHTFWVERRPLRIQEPLLGPFGAITFLLSYGADLWTNRISNESVRGGYSWTSEPKRLHHTLCRQPCGWRVLGLQRGIPYEVSRDRRS